jgi:hypothetical protein
MLLGGNPHLQDFLEHQEAANAFPSKEDPYLSHFKSIAFTVPEIFTNLLAEDTWRKS